MTAPIRWVLFDADGVLQQMPPTWLQDLQTLFGEHAEEALPDLFEREFAIQSGGSFRAVVSAVLQEYGITVDPDEVMQGWRSVQVDPAMLGRIADLRARGIGCAMATNQHDVRVAYMRSLPDYAGVFDEQFYSSELGFAKPDPDYFRAIVKRLDARPEQTLFVDDRDDNVAGAREAGLQAEVFTAHGGVVELDRILATRTWASTPEK